MNFSLRTKIGGLAKAGRLPMVAAAAIGASLTFGTGVAHALTEGFDVKNNTNEPWGYCGFTIYSNPNVIESRPDQGAQLLPGQSWHFEITRFAGRDNVIDVQVCNNDQSKIANLTLISPNIFTAGSVNAQPFFQCDNFCSQVGRFRGDQITITG